MWKGLLVTPLRHIKWSLISFWLLTLLKSMALAATVGNQGEIPLFSTHAVTAGMEDLTIRIKVVYAWGFFSVDLCR